MSLYPNLWFLLQVGKGKDLERSKMTFSRASSTVPEADKQKIKRYLHH